MRQVSLLLDLKANLGECPRWHARENLLYFVDIAACSLNRFDPVTGTLQTRRFGEPVGCFAFRRQGGLVLGMRDGFALLAHFDGEPSPFGPKIEAAHPDIRLNDGRADVSGRFWAGTYDSSMHNRSKLYCLSPDGQVTEQLSGLQTSNGLAFSPDGKILYHADTPAHRVTAYDFDPARGAIALPRVIHQFTQGQGRPDGASVDEDGFYWSALYAGGRVVKIAPDGMLVEQVAIPAFNITMIAFGGPDRRTAYVTTARQNTPDGQLEHYPHAGGLFSFQVETPGLPEFDFAG